MSIDRTAFNALVDDDGTGSFGTLFQKSTISSVILDPIDALIPQGVWTPVLGGSGGTSGQTYSTQAGIYVKSGQLVLASYLVILTAKGTITGNVQIQGLPFSSNGTTANYIAPVSFVGMATNWISIVTFLDVGATAATLNGIAAAGTGNNNTIVAADITNTTRMSGTILYRAGA